MRWRAKQYGLYKVVNHINVKLWNTVQTTSTSTTQTTNTYNSWFRRRQLAIPRRRQVMWRWRRCAKGCPLHRVVGPAGNRPGTWYPPGTGRTRTRNRTWWVSSKRAGASQEPNEFRVFINVHHHQYTRCQLSIES